MSSVSKCEDIKYETKKTSPATRCSSGGGCRQRHDRRIDPHGSTRRRFLPSATACLRRCGLRGIAQRDEMRGKTVQWQVARKRSTLKVLADRPLNDVLTRVQNGKARVRAQVEHPFHFVMNL